MAVTNSTQSSVYYSFCVYVGWYEIFLRSYSRFEAVYDVGVNDLLL